jgi:SAM-dependent methyltransferase
VGEPEPRRPSGAEDHWDSAYKSRAFAGVSWFQPAAITSAELVRRLAIPKDAAVIDVGGGASTLMDTLVADGFVDLTVLDISGVALDAVCERLGPSQAVTLVHADVLAWAPDRQFDLWHYRAVFHFLVDSASRSTYVAKLHRALRRGGAVIVGTFAPNGPEYCSGLPVARYSPDELAEALGGDFGDGYVRSCPDAGWPPPRRSGERAGRWLPRTGRKSPVGRTGYPGPDARRPGQGRLQITCPERRMFQRRRDALSVAGQIPLTTLLAWAWVALHR